MRALWGTALLLCCAAAGLQQTQAQACVTNPSAPACANFRLPVRRTGPRAGPALGGAH